MILTDITNYTVVIWIAAAITASLGLIVYFGGSTRSSRMFLVTVLTVAAWTATVGAFMVSSTVDIATFFVKMAYFVGTMTAVAFFSFFLVYPEDKKQKPIVWAAIWSVIVALAYVYFYTDISISHAHAVDYAVRYGWDYGSFPLFFYATAYPFFTGGLYLLWRKIRRIDELRVKRNLQYMGVSLLVFFVPPTVTNVIMPTFGYFQLIWIGPILSLGWVSVITYSIARFRQLDLRTFTSEILNVALIIIFFTNIFNSFSGSVLGRALTFVVFLVISVFIIRLGSKLDDFNRTLQSKVAEQTKEIQGLYEVEKKARLELEHLNEAKDQFILVTQHHLRTPITQIRWSLESFKSQRPDDASFQEDVGNALDTVDHLNHILENFLDIAQLQVGKSVLTLEKASLLPMVAESLQELSHDIHEMKLEISYPKDAKAWPDVLVDKSKVKEVVFVVIQNAVKYNRPGGTITVEPSVSGKTFNLTVTDTGIGISAADKSKLFNGVFTRNATAVKVNPLGMGMGLTFARYILRAHKGSLDIESEGKDKGAKVIVTMPLA